MKNAFGVATLSLLLSGCITYRTPGNSENPGGPQGYMAERAAIPASIQAEDVAKNGNLKRCFLTPLPISPTTSYPAEGDMPLSAGDLVRVNVADDEQPTGSYKVSGSGVIALVGIGDLNVTGLTVAEAQADLDHLLVSKHVFRRAYTHASLRVLDRGPARVGVTGAVFQPGQVVINDPSPSQIDPMRAAAIGDHALGRTLANALSSAAGVRPDADLAHVVLQHGMQRRTVDLSGILTGQNTDNPMLADGDLVVVPSLHCFQNALARPTPITPPGVKIFFSNLTTPAGSNASAEVSANATSLPYGTRLLQALVAGNCVGGTKMTNADRSAVLITTNLSTGASEVIERRIESLVRRADRDDFNPVLMNNDAIACYDSFYQNIRDVLNSLGNAALAATAAGGIGKL